jgi:hypothetical protein
MEHRFNIQQGSVIICQNCKCQICLQVNYNKNELYEYMYLYPGCSTNWTDVKLTCNEVIAQSILE